MVKKNCSCSKNIERGQNIFELADGIGMRYISRNSRAKIYLNGENVSLNI